VIKEEIAMKQILRVLLAMLLLGTLCGIAPAMDLTALDRVTITMTKSEVLSLLGEPDEVTEIGNGLKAEVYTVNGLEPMVGTGCIYENNRRLVGQSFIFQGEMDRVAADRLVELGFSVMEDTEGNIRLLGKDDDTGRPLVATLSHDKDMTIIMTFEKGFYDRQVK